MTLGSLFDGSGGFPLAGAIHGITPMWASEIEPYSIRVTKARFPQMKHLGDVTKINGAEVEPVDIITFGSPCQDLSAAGKRDGLEGSRSNLFYEAIRIIKEMRRATNGKYPRIAVWENVPGAYSSNKGEDFRAVLQAFCSIKDETADVPRPASGKWHPAGAIVGNGWSIAWRTFDAKFWGVPQRRKRVYLIASFGNERASEIFSEQCVLSWDREKIESEEIPYTGKPDGPTIVENRYSPGSATWWDGGDISQCLDAVLYKKQALPEKSRFPTVLVPAWEKCEMCDDFICNLHGCHVYECDCPDTDDWCDYDIWPYDSAILRYITPLECCRLQGFPTGGRTACKAQTARGTECGGNGIALPNAEYVIGCAKKLIEGKLPEVEE